MSTQHTEPADTAAAPEANGAAGKHEADRRTFATAEEAQAAGKALATQTLYAAKDDKGGALYCWARHAGQASQTFLLALGWAVAPHGAAPADKARAALAALPESERAALLAEYGVGKGRKGK